MNTHTYPYAVSTKKTNIDFGLVHRFLSGSYWSPDIPDSTLRKAIENSLCFSVFSSSGEQVGFARVITDKATFAYLADVFILAEHRGKDLSKQLIQTVLDYPNVQGIRRFMLATKDAHALYEQFGFKALASPQTFMEIWNPTIYDDKR